MQGCVSPEFAEKGYFEPNSTSFMLGCLLFFLATGGWPSWTGHVRLDHIFYEGLTRSIHDPLPTFSLSSGVRSVFLHTLFAKFISYRSEERISLLQIQKTFADFVQRQTRSSFQSSQKTSIRSLQTPVQSEMGSVPFHVSVIYDSSETHIRLPTACLELPERSQHALLNLMNAGKYASWFSGEGDIRKGIEYLRTHTQHVQSYVRFALAQSISHVRCSWSLLKSNCAASRDIESVVRRASRQILRENSSHLDRAGRVAWSALDQYAFSRSLLLPFHLADSAISTTGWSVASHSDWSIALAASKSEAKAHAKAAGRLEAWESAKSVVWRSIWPSVQKKMASCTHPIEHAAMWSMAWDASWHAAWLTIADLPEAPVNPFESLWNVWKMGLYPMLLHNNDYLLVELDSTNTTEFQINLM